jgi:hypothetical protein
MLLDIYFPRLQVLAVPNFPTRRQHDVLFYTYLLSIISAITQECYLSCRRESIRNMSKESKPIGLLTQQLH